MPADLEAVLLTHPAIEVAGVLGIRNSFDALGKPRAYVQLKKPGSIAADEIQQWMKEKVAKYKWLTGGVMFIDQVPKSPVGKFQRKILREWAKRGGQPGIAKM